MCVDRYLSEAVPIEGYRRGAVGGFRVIVAVASGTSMALLLLRIFFFFCFFRVGCGRNRHPAHCIHILVVRAYIATSIPIGHCDVVVSGSRVHIPHDCEPGTPKGAPN